MANTLRFKRGLASGIPTAAAGEPLFTTDTFDLYIGNGTTNTRFQKYIASGATTQILRGDGSLYTFPLAISSPSNGQVLKYNGTSWVNDSDAGITGSGSAGQVAYFTGATTQGGNNNLFWDATNNRLGIGTNVPSFDLYVKKDYIGSTAIAVGNQGTINASTLMEFVLSESGGNNGYFRRYRDGTGLIEIGFTDILAFKGSIGGTPTERARITALGNFHIGTFSSDSGEKLQVTGTMKVTGATTIGGALNLVTNTWHTSSDARQRIYFEASSITYIKGDGVRLRNNSDVDALIIAPSTAATFASSVTATSFNGATTNIFTVGGTQYMGLTSTGLSIGSAFSPDSKLHVLSGGGTPTNQFRINFNNTNDNYIDAANHYWRSGNGSILRLALDASGNLGLGVTPSAWDSLWSAEQFGQAGSLFAYKSGSNYTVLSNNSYAAGGGYQSGDARYINNGFSTAYIQNNSGQHLWMTSASGSANAAITFTQAMTLDASGRLGIGTTSPVTKLSVSDGTNALHISHDANGAYISGANNAFTVYKRLTYDAVEQVFATNSTEKMRLSQGGRLLLGFTTDSGELLQVNGTAKITGATTIGGGSSATSQLDVTSNSSANGITLRNRTGNDYAFFNWRSFDGTELLAESYIQRTAANTATLRHTINNGSGVANYLTIASTGAATFSSSVTATQFTSQGGRGTSFGYRLPDWQIYNTSTGNGLAFNNYTTDCLTIASTGAATFSSSVTAGGNITSSTNIGATGAGGTLYTLNGGDIQVYTTGNANFFSLSSPTSGNFLVKVNQGLGAINALNIANTGAATFSSSVLANATSIFSNSLGLSAIFSNGGATSNYNSIELRGGTIGSAVNWQISKDNSTGNAFELAPSTTAGGTTYGSPVFKILNTGAATFSSSIEAATAIAIGTTPDTNNPFKILKNINATVGIKFENTNTSSSAFSAVQLGTDVTGGTKFTNLVYASSGISASGVYNPDGTSLINNGNGGLNFLGNPIRMYTGGSNGVLRWDLVNDGFITHYSATAPTTSATDGYRQYSADVTAGNAAPHFRTENGAVIKLYQETTSVGNSIISLGGGNSVLDDTTFDGYTLRQIVKALRNQGILA
jgi:hypothetical protein